MPDIFIFCFSKKERANRLPWSQRFFLIYTLVIKRRVKSRKNFWDQGINHPTYHPYICPCGGTKNGNSNRPYRQVGVLLTKNPRRDDFIGALAYNYGFHHLKHLSGLSYICTLAKFDFNFKQYLSCIYQGQIWKHICPTFVIFTTRTNITSDLSCICPKAKYDQIHYFTQWIAA